MGTKPALATIYIGQLEETFLLGRASKPEIWFWYIDDVFMVWAYMYSLNELHTYLSKINSVQKRIKFTAEISEPTCNFLDLTIYKSLSFEETGLLSTRIYYKHLFVSPQH